MMEQGFPSDLFLAKDNVYAALVDDVSRNEMITDDVVRAVRSGHCPLLVDRTNRTSPILCQQTCERGRQVFVLKGGMGKKQRRETAAGLASVPGANLE
jgi:hypothetical protein